MRVLLFSNLIKFTALATIKMDALRRTHSKPDGEEEKDNDIYTVRSVVYSM